MDDLVRFLLTLFQNDAAMILIFQANGSNTVTVGGIGQRREIATYPKIIVYAINEEQEYYSDGDPTQAIGKIKIEVATQQNLLCADAELCRQQITARIYQLISGTPMNAGISGTQISTNFKLTHIYKATPTGEVPNQGNPKTVRWIGTYNARVNENSIYGLVPTAPSGTVYMPSIIDKLP